MKSWSAIKKAKMDPARIERVREEAKAELRAFTLKQLREAAGKTQVEMAELIEMTQSALSRIEHREDNQVETLRRYVEALGGELELVAVIGNQRVKLLSA